MKKLLSIVLTFVFCMSLICVPAVADDYVTYELVVVDNCDGTATVTAFAPAGVYSGKIVVCTTDKLSYIAGSGESDYVFNENYDKNGVKGVCVTFASALVINEKIQVFKGLYAVADGDSVSSSDVFSEEWNLTNGQENLSNQASGNVDVKVEYITYTVTFIGKNGETLKTEAVSYDAAATAPEAPAVEGYTFSGWDKTFDSVKSDLTITAVYTINTYTVTFVGKDGVAIKTESVSHGTAATAPEAPVVEGYTFIGWDNAFDSVKDDLTVTALYEAKGKFGDVNGDTKVNNLDAASILKYDAGIFDETGLDLGVANVNGDTKVNNLDASTILKYDAGIIPSL